METTPVGKVPATGTQVRPADHAKHGGAKTAVPADAIEETAAVELRLTELGHKALEAAHPGKAGQSPAHQARAFLAVRGAETGTVDRVAFGQVVSRMARGLDPEEAFAAPAEEIAQDDAPPAAEEETEAVDDGSPAPLVEAGGIEADALVAGLLDELSEPEDEAA